MVVVVLVVVVLVVVVLVVVDVVDVVVDVVVVVVDVVVAGNVSFNYDSLCSLIFFCTCFLAHADAAGRVVGTDRPPDGLHLHARLQVRSHLVLGAVYHAEEVADGGAHG